MKSFFMILTVTLIAATVAVSEPKKMAVTAFEIKNDAVTVDEADMIMELYISELESTGKVAVVDRTNLSKALATMNFKDADLLDKEKTKTLGKIVGAEILSYGQITKMGNSLYIISYIINIETSSLRSSGWKRCNDIDGIYDVLEQYVPNLLTPKIGDIGPGGGFIFRIEGERAWECSPIIADDVSLDDALYLCENYHGGGCLDWHLPSAVELKMMYYNLAKTGIIPCLFSYWSSSIGMTADHTFLLEFETGKIRTDINTKGSRMSVRFVRSFNF